VFNICYKIYGKILAQRIKVAEATLTEYEHFPERQIIYRLHIFPASADRKMCGIEYPSTCCVKGLYPNQTVDYREK